MGSGGEDNDADDGGDAAWLVRRAGRCCDHAPPCRSIVGLRRFHLMADGKPCSVRRAPESTGRLPRVSAERTKCRVLVVDDVEDNRDLYATYFDHLGFHTEQACNGEEALAKIAESTPDVVIMDLSMPKLDGCDATRMIKANPRTSHVHVIVVTGHTTAANIAAAREAGADEVCAKPCVPRELLDLVQRWFEVGAVER